MKKLLILAIAIIPFTASAYITPGTGSTFKCVPSTESRVGIVTGIGKSIDPDGTAGCNSQEDIYKRLADLEKVTNQLEQANATLQKKVDQTPAGQTTQTIVKDPDNTKVDALEKRVTALESAVSSIQTKVMQALTTTIGLLQKLLAR